MANTIKRVTESEPNAGAVGALDVAPVERLLQPRDHSIGRFRLGKEIRVPRQSLPVFGVHRQQALIESDRVRALAKILRQVGHIQERGGEPRIQCERQLQFTFRIRVSSQVVTKNYRPIQVRLLGAFQSALDRLRITRERRFEATAHPLTKAEIVPSGGVLGGLPHHTLVGVRGLRIAQLLAQV